MVREGSAWREQEEEEWKGSCRTDYLGNGKARSKDDREEAVWKEWVGLEGRVVTFSEWKNESYTVLN